MCVYEYISIYMFLRACVCGTYVSMYTYDYVYGYICIGVYVCEYIYIYIYIGCFKIR